MNIINKLTIFFDIATLIISIAIMVMLICK